MKTKIPKKFLNNEPITDDLQKLIYDYWLGVSPMLRDLTTLSGHASRIAKEYFTKVKKENKTIENKNNNVTIKIIIKGAKTNGEL